MQPKKPEQNAQIIYIDSWITYFVSFELCNNET